MRCKYCGHPIHKVLIGWIHDWPTQSIHIAKPKRW